MSHVEPGTERAQEQRTRIRLLGALSVEIDGRDVAAEAPGGQARSLLAFLAAGLERGADREELVGLLWPGRPPKDPQAALRPILSRLRRAVAPGTIEGRERLRLVLPAPIWVDVEDASRALAAARAAARSGRWEQVREEAEVARERLEPGFLPGDDSDWAADRRRQLDELGLEAVEWAARSSLALGGPELRAAERASRALVARAPFRETGYRFLMEALAASGDAAEALRVYEELRVLLREELGAAPAAEIQELHRRLLAGEAPPLRSPPESPRPEPAPPRPLATRLAPGERAALVGRERELEVLRSAWEDARRGQRRVVALVGEAGIGKTRLTSELAAHVEEQGTVLYAACQEEALAPYQAFVDVLRDYVRTEGLERAREVLGPGATELARLVPELATVLPAPAELAADPETRRYLLFEGVRLFLAEASERTPLALVLDDLHWADQATIHLLRHVLRSPHETSLLVVGAYRDEGPVAGHALAELVTDLQRDGRLDRVSLQGLDEESVGRLIVSRAGHEASRGLVETVRERTRGNPFFVAEVMRHLVETGVLYERDGRWVSARMVDEIGVPDGVKQVVGARIRRLSHDCRLALSHAAVLGHEFAFDVLGAMTDMQEDALIAALEEALDVDLVAEASGRVGPTYAFVHALVRETLYGGLSAPRRQRLHGRAAAALEERRGAQPGPSLDAIASHLLAAAPVGADAARAVAAAEEAALSALERDAYEQAVALLTPALALVGPDDADRGRRLTRTRAVAFQRLSHAAFDVRPAGR